MLQLLLSCRTETQRETFKEDNERVNGGYAAPPSPLRDVFLGVLNRSHRCLLPPLTLFTDNVFTRHESATRPRVLLLDTARQSKGQRKPKYFVYPVCIPIRTILTLMFRQRLHWYMLFWTVSKRRSTLLSDSLR